MVHLQHLHPATPAYYSMHPPKRGGRTLPLASPSHSARSLPSSCSTTRTAGVYEQSAQMARSSFPLRGKAWTKSSACPFRRRPRGNIISL
ncbi:predicted protein [Plenodomus lingam JN3]|uniref:Uncharacterized protein n=1 Tax=Leptosphaeria maculans (strain JN3 / isolate v23.1.3 / race Av1-4-5-6-7-8) TaxID=985895 RepID=E5A725_LEPMJ|nr:predicted protein [Plenodomus lingam JN3]CBX99420.1 predicted protein [Plenodomus lingam JN3]